MISRCPRCLSDPLYIAYHDTERWVPVHDDRVHFEFLVLEAAQAGLSRLTVLKKREWYREAFAGFDPVKVAAFDASVVEELLQNPWIIRNRAKIQAAITNARVFLDIQKEWWTFDAYLRHFTDGKVINNHLQTKADYVATSPLSDAVSRDLKCRGMKFVWSTIMYAHLQAVGIVNDHLVECFRHEEVKAMKQLEIRNE